MRQIETKFKSSTVFVSGSAEEYGKMGKDAAQGFIHKLSKQIIEDKLRLVNGFGWGVGSAVINGALDAIYDKSGKFSDNQLILRPFPQFKSGTKELPELWQEYRVKMIGQVGIAIFVFGNRLKKGTTDIENANGVRLEFEIAKGQGCFLIPIGITGYMASELWQEVMGDFAAFYPNHLNLKDKFQKLGDQTLSEEEILKNVKEIINLLKNK